MLRFTRRYKRVLSVKVLVSPVPQIPYDQGQCRLDSEHSQRVIESLDMVLAHPSRHRALVPVGYCTQAPKFLVNIALTAV